MEYFISKSNFSDFFPNLLNGIHLGCIRRNENNTDIFRDDQRVRLVPSCSIAYKALCRRTRSVRYGASCVPSADDRQRAPFNVGARLVVHQKGRYDHSAFYHRALVPELIRLGRRRVWYAR